MSEFFQTLLSDIIKVQRNRDCHLKESEYQLTGRFPIIDQGENFIAGYTDSEFATRSMYPPAIVFGDHTLRLKYIDFRFAPGTHGVQIIRGSNPAYVDKYLYYLIQREVKLMGSSGYKRHMRTLMNRVIPFTSNISTQKKIASILTSIDEAIVSARTEIAKLHLLKKATINELFTGGNSSDIGRVPLNWHVCAFKQIESKQDKGMQVGVSGGELKSFEYKEFGVPLAMPSNIDSPYMNTDSITRISEKKADQFTKYRLSEGDILFSRRSSIGSFALITESNAGWICGTGCLRVRFDRQVVSPQFVAQYLFWDYPIDWLKHNARGTKMLNLSTSILGSLPVIVPPLAEQARIVTVLGAIDQRILDCKTLLEKHEFMKQAVMEDLLTGELHVRVA